MKRLLWQGTLAAVIAGSAAFVCARFVSSGFIYLFRTDIATGIRLAVGFILVFHLVNLFWMGMVSTFFWHRVRPRPPRFLPQVLLILVLHLAFPFLWSFAQGTTQNHFTEMATAYILTSTLVSLWPLQLSIEFGLKWWPKRRYRHFFGLANDYEYEAKDESK